MPRPTASFGNQNVCGYGSGRHRTDLVTGQVGKILAGASPTKKTSPWAGLFSLASRTEEGHPGLLALGTHADPGTAAWAASATAAVHCVARCKPLSGQGATHQVSGGQVKTAKLGLVQG